MLPIKDSLQKDYPLEKEQTHINALTTESRGRAISTNGGKLINNDKDENMNNCNFDMVIGKTRDYVSETRGNSMVASHDTGTHYSEPSHFDSDDNSIGTSPKRLGKVVMLVVESLVYNKSGSKGIPVSDSSDSSSSNSCISTRVMSSNVRNSRSLRILFNWLINIDA